MAVHNRGRTIVWEFDSATITWDAASRRRLSPSRLHDLGAPPGVDSTPAAQAGPLRSGSGAVDAAVARPRSSRLGALAPSGAEGAEVLAERFWQTSQCPEATAVDHAVAAWVARGGLELAVRVAAHVFQSAPRDGYQRQPRGAQILVEKLRPHLVRADGPTYAAARRAVLSFVSRDEPVTLACLAACFTAEEEWTFRALQHALEGKPLPGVLFALLTPYTTDPCQADAIARATVHWPRGMRDHPFDLVAHLGPEAVRPMRTLLVERWSDSSVVDTVRALARIDSEPAARLLLPLGARRPLRKTVLRYAKYHAASARPVLHALIETPTDEALDLAQAHDISDSLEALRAELSRAPAVGATEAWPDDAPEGLRFPPWTRPRARPPIRELASLSYEERYIGPLGGSEENSTADSQRTDAETDVGRLRQLVRSADEGGARLSVEQLLVAPMAEALAVWNEGRPERYAADRPGRITALAARFGLEGLTGLLRYAEGKPARAADALASYDSPRVAAHLALRIARNDRSEAWFGEHPRAAAIGLIPYALSGRRGAGAKKRRTAARLGLRFLAQIGRGRVVREVASAYGVVEEVEHVLRDDLPAHPALPSFVRLEQLPRLRTTRGAELPVTASDVLARLLSCSHPVPCASLEEVRSGCDPGSLDSFARALFAQWVEHGADPAEDWAIAAVGRLGSDASIDELIERVNEWQRSGSSQRAGKLLDAIAMLGTEAALMHVDRVARKSPYPKLRARARVAVANAARQMGLSGDELEDRTAPTLGMGREGASVLSLGERSIRVSFDGSLQLVLQEVGGRRLTRFPRRRASDDGPAHAVAKQHVRSLRRHAREVAEQQIARLERMMVAERNVREADFERFFVRHPLVRHLVERLVWAADGVTFRVAEDGTYADIGDDELTLGGDAQVVLVHPRRLSVDVRHRWADRLADYELVQPFRQLGRPVFEPTPREIAADRLLRLEGAIVDWPQVVDLVRRGFEPETRDGLRYTRFVGERWGARLSVTFSPGLHVGTPTGSGRQTIVEAIAPLRDASPVLQSELFLALEPVHG